jgi:hypothetical protein
MPGLKDGLRHQEPLALAAIGTDFTCWMFIALTSSRSTTVERIPPVEVPRIAAVTYAYRA